MTLTLRSLLAATTIALGLAATQAPAAGKFGPAIVVNDSVITNYELEQRERFLTALRAPGNPKDLAKTQLIEDQLKIGASKVIGVKLEKAEIEAGMDEFAGRANLSREQFIGELKSFGIDASTFEDFVRAGIAWRYVVQQKFAGKIEVSDSDVDRAINPTSGAVSVLISEIIIPITPETAEQVNEVAADIARVTTPGAFARAARNYSATPTAPRGGDLGWKKITELPPFLQPILLGLAPGQVTEPLPLPDAVALFQLRDISEGAYQAPKVASVDYATLLIDASKGIDTARKVLASVDRCDDLYGINKGKPEELLTRQSLAPSEIPSDIAIEIAKLDENEGSINITRNGGTARLLVMVCGRTTEVTESETPREDIVLGLQNQRLQTYADAYLEQLKSDAHIEYK